MILNANILLSAYTQGLFPMADSCDGDIFWHSPDPRAVFPLANLHISRSTRQLLRKNIYHFSIDQNFEEVVRRCGDREETWINDEIIREYSNLHKLGYAHSIEAWHGDKLVGGLYGVHIGGGFFGESMYGTESNVTKLCFCILCRILIENGFILLDSQYINDFTESLGAIEIPRKEYMAVLEKAIAMDCNFEWKD